MAQAHANRGISETSKTYNSDYQIGDKVAVKFSTYHNGTIVGKWSNFGILVQFDGNKNSTIINLKSDTVLKIN